MVGRDNADGHLYNPLLIMKYAILGDIHANLEALTVVLKDAKDQGITKFISMGDVVGYGASPSECLDILMDLDCEIVQGNHDFYAACDTPIDRFTSAAARTVIWTRTQLSPEHRTFLANLPLVKTMGNVTICHSSLWHPEDWNYVIDHESAGRSLSQQESQICFVGHTHVPRLFQSNDELKMWTYESFTLKDDHKYLINPGSVGQPRDENPLTGYAILDLEANSVRLRRLAYDIKTAQQKIRAAGLPEKNAFRLELGR